MLFNSFEFIFRFLPITLVIFWLIGRWGHPRAAIAWLVLASVFFYGWWNPAYLGLLIFLLVFNYGVGYALGHSSTTPVSRKWLLTLGIAVDLAILGYYKYANFFVNGVNSLAGTDLNWQRVVLPLGISFFTFQKIAYLVDAYKGKTKGYDFLNYCLFVTFFPQLIAGPIVHHSEVIPQFESQSLYRFNVENLKVGLTIFALGLFKKAVFADHVAVYATPIFEAANQGVVLGFFEAWSGAIAYALQLYFDFSGYSDMAIGAARLFGVQLPMNFNSPYKATNIIDFWRRWHITLSHFLRDYLYISLGGNRQGKFRRYLNLMLTMLLGGLWHGAGWTFVFWGGLHGAYLVINHQWQTFRRSLGHDLSQSSWWSRLLSSGVTFLVVVIAWVFFKADSMDDAAAMLWAMFGLNGISVPPFLAPQLAFLQDWGFKFNGINGSTGLPALDTIAWIGSLLAIAWLTPNTQQWLERYQPTLDYPPGKAPTDPPSRLWQGLQWRLTPAFGVVFGILVFICLKVALDAPVSEFLYFNF